MTNTEKKIAEIREALEKATPGPWKWIDPGGYDRKKLVGEHEIMNFGASMTYLEFAGQEPDDADAHLIANAPEWLEWAVQEIERLREENEGRKKIIEAYMRIEHDLAEEAERYLQQRDKLIERLRFYERLARGREVNDGGRRARTILAEIGVTVE